MNKFSQAYSNSRDKVLSEKRVLVEQEHTQIVNAMKTRFGIDDFSMLEESEKESYRSMLNEMWTRENGLTKAGIDFINEGVYKLTTEATPEQMLKKFNTMLDGTVMNNLMSAIVGSSTSFEGISNIVNEIESQAKKKLPRAEAKKILQEKIFAYIKSRVNKIKI